MTATRVPPRIIGRSIPTTMVPNFHPVLSEAAHGLLQATGQPCPNAALQVLCSRHEEAVCHHQSCVNLTLLNGKPTVRSTNLPRRDTTQCSRHLPQPLHSGILIGRIRLAGSDIDLSRDGLVDSGLLLLLQQLDQPFPWRGCSAGWRRSAWSRKRTMARCSLRGGWPTAILPITLPEMLARPVVVSDR